MKFMIAFAALVAVANAQYLRDSSVVVEGSKAILEGPSGTVAADSGSIVRDGAARGFIAPSVAGLVAPNWVAPRSIIGSPLLSRSILDARGLYDPLLDNRGLYNPLHTVSGLYNPLLDSGIYGARNLFY